MFTSIVVPLDLGEQGDRALGYVGRLSLLAELSVELVVVSSPLLDSGVDRYELDRRARMLPRADCITKVIHGEDSAAAIAAHLAGRTDALLAMATHARGVLAGLVLESVSEAILRRHDGPTLLFGPHFRPSRSVGPPTLVVLVDQTKESEVILDAARMWSATFAGPPLRVVEVVEPDAARSVPGCKGAAERSRVDRVAARLGESPRDVGWEVVQGRRPADALVDLADRDENVVLALASRHWTDPEHRHLASVTRAVVHRSQCPVLVLPQPRPEEGELHGC